ncbi:hypothetical protein Tco_0299904 [Tanacetum coccineum]
MSSQGRQIVQVDFLFINDLEYLRGGSNDKKYTASTTKSKAARYELKGIEYMVPNLWSPVKVVYDRYDLLPSAGVESYQKKLNLTKPRTRDVNMSRTPVYTTLSKPQGMIYEDKLKRKRFISADKLYKFSDGALISVRDTVDQMLYELHLGYNTAMRRRL